MVERDADYYHAHKDDPQEWGPAQAPPATPKRRLAAMLSVRFTPQEEAAVRGAAGRRGESVSQFIRRATLGAAGPGAAGTAAGGPLQPAPHAVTYVPAHAELGTSGSAPTTVGLTLTTRLTRQGG